MEAPVTLVHVNGRNCREQLCGKHALLRGEHAGMLGARMKTQITSRLTTIRDAIRTGTLLTQGQIEAWSIELASLRQKCRDRKVEPFRVITTTSSDVTA